MAEQEQKDPRETLRDLFVIEQKIDAFCDSFEPADDELAPDMDIRSFNDSALRKYFNAYPKTIGDPLVIYIEDLEVRGFKFKTSSLGDEPVIIVRCK